MENNFSNNVVISRVNPNQVMIKNLLLDDVYQKYDFLQTSNIDSKLKNKENTNPKVEKSYQFKSNTQYKKDSLMNDYHLNNLENNLSVTEQSLQKNPQYPIEYIPNIIATLKTKDSLYIKMSEFYNNSTLKQYIFERDTFISKAIYILDGIKFDDETLFLSVFIFDEFIAIDNPPINFLNLIGTSTIIIASKIHDIEKINISNFCQALNNGFDASHIIQMESRILKSIQFDLNIPSPLIFLKRIQIIEDTPNQIFMLAKLILEIGLFSIDFVKLRPSIRAVSAFILALEIFSVHKNIDKAYNEFSIDYHEVNQAKEILKILLHQVFNSKFSTLRKKYSSDEKLKVSTLLK